ncbi:MAG TPA: DUF721 domain-containing protein [Bacteroidetes bacterium]|nr:DUF721 domain-containing protein [Bacteroidota bacterium]
MSDIKPLGKVLEDLLQMYRLKSKVNEVNLTRDWEAIVGPLIAKKTEKIVLKNGVLHITISSAPLKQELRYSKDQILSLIEERFGKGYVTGLEVH